MKTATFTWVFGLLVSLAAHAVLAVGMMWALQPDDVVDQPKPDSRLQMAAYRVTRADAKEAEPQASPVEEGDPATQNVNSGAVPVSQGSPVRPSTETISQSSPVAQSLAAARPNTTASAPELPASDQVLPSNADDLIVAVAQVSPSENLQSANTVAMEPRPIVQQTIQSIPAVAEPPSATQIASAQPSPVDATLAPLANVTAASVLVSPKLSPITANSGTEIETASLLSLSAEAASSQPVPLETASATNVATIAPPIPNLVLAALPTASAPVQSAPLSPNLPSSEKALSRQPDPVQSQIQEPDVSSALDGEIAATSSQPLGLPEVKGKASLAFSGNKDGPIDPVSLAAYQSFMAPESIGSNSKNVKDGVSALFASIPCSRMQVQFEPDSNSVVLVGHVPEPDMRASVVSKLQEEMGADIPVMDNLLILPQPQCGALAGISTVGLPQSTDQITNPLLVGENTHAREFHYVNGQAMVLGLQGADYDAFVYVDFFDAGGNVIHLMPNEHTPMQLAPAKSELKIGSDEALSPGEPGLFIQVGPPFGQEIAVAFASSVPLYENTRPLVEPAEPYLNWLRERVSEARAANPDFKGEWVYFFVSTSAN